MQFMVFTDKMIDGVAAIDRQHRLLIDILNMLYTITLTKDADTSLETVFDELARYTTEHFDYEEKLFAETGYPGLEQHRAQHQALTRRITEFRNAYNGGNDTILASDLLHVLKRWLTDHTMHADKEACRHLNAHGIR